MNFPPNPSDGMLFEPIPGLVYKYNKSVSTWVEMLGYGQEDELATPLRDGLMSKNDLRKINGLLLPPPKTTLTAQGCSFTFEEGTFGFRSSKSHLYIETELSTFEKDSDGNNVERKNLWKIHENTYGINFRVNLPLLVSDLESRGRLTYRKTIGPQGKKGEQGDKGIDNLETGPKGSVGDDGKNASFSGFLSSESGSLLATEGNRGIVDISTEQVSSEESNIVAVRANLGNSQFCPRLVKPKKIESKWIVVVDERPAVRRLLECDEPGEKKECSSGPGCAPGSKSISEPGEALVQNFCSTRLYYLDMTPIELEIRQRFDEQLAELKTAKENLVLEWLKAMIDVYNEQKLALCCAIENCQSRRENMRHRQYIETQRVQGAIGHVKISVEGENSAKAEVVETEPGRNCPGDIPISAGIVVDPTGTEAGLDCVAKFFVSCSDNAPTEDQAVEVVVPEGSYEVRITDCCCFTSDDISYEDYLRGLDDINNIKPEHQEDFQNMKPFTGALGFTFQEAGETVRLLTPDHGSFHTDPLAQDKYIGVNFKVQHSGGAMKVWFNGGSSRTRALGNAGKMEVCILDLNSVNTSRALIDGSVTDPCAVPALDVDVNCRLNTNRNNAVITTLDVGEYVAEVTDCCCDSLFSEGEGEILSGITGTIALEYQSVAGTTVLYNPDMGSFNDLNQALNAYIGNTIIFSHRGGEVRIWTTARNAGGNGGTMRVSIEKKECVDVPPPEPVPPDTVPEADHFETCVMSLDQINFYEAGWKSKACCGAYVEAGGVRWLVVKRSIGTDTSCGGGENADSDCIKQGAQFGFHPALAFPTQDGKHFFGKPTGGVQVLFRDPDLETEIINKILAEDLLEEVGQTIDFNAILFPYEA